MFTQSHLAIVRQVITTLRIFIAGRDSESQEGGQGLAEYVLILVMVGVVAMAVLITLGPGIGNLYANIISELRPVFMGE